MQFNSFYMSITVTISKAASDRDIDQVQLLVRHLQDFDLNFKGRAIRIERGFITSVVDTDDLLRGALLKLMVDSLLSRPDQRARVASDV